MRLDGGVCPEVVGWVRQKIAELGQDFGQVRLYFGSVGLFLQGFSLKFPKFWVRKWKPAEFQLA